MTYFESIILGIVQGVTEFLPVSSSGHLVIFENLFQLAGNHVGFNVAVHLGTLFSVLTVYRRTIWQLVHNLYQSAKNKEVNVGLQIFLFVFLASIPTGIMGIFLKDMWHQLFSSLLAVGIFLCVTGTLLFLTRRTSGKPVKLGDSLPLDVDGLTWKKALFVGFAQGCAIAPGISRSGTTIAVAMLLGCDRNIAALFSFLLVIPAILGATLLEMPGIEWSPEVLKVMLLGLVSAYLAGVIGLKLILKVVKNGRLEFFTPYLFLVGVGTIIYAVFQ